MARYRCLLRNGQLLLGRSIRSDLAIRSSFLYGVARMTSFRNYVFQYQGDRDAISIDGDAINYSLFGSAHSSCLGTFQVLCDADCQGYLHRRYYQQRRRGRGDAVGSIWGSGLRGRVGV